ncbi:type II toxin-antitoxin system RelE/ParE family toxin [Clostridium sp. Marseille-P2415]|uniref:type II toxin-antitoxin system RelE/ParE family toxin n=1 Tax=Clostridium sp. Marseille-P2415 TaxID=1805471 RepID=UPI00098888C8|nr:type II toxin-antitoxin system RelE/ParE family toxin [Clostridium sp. Marseille-P2415]
MDEKIVNLHKILYPEEYATVYVFTYPTFNKELRDLIENSGYIKEFKTKYHKSLRFLEQLKKSCIMQPKLFEQLVNTDGIYSIILHGQKNIRILFSFYESDKKEIAVLYNCFEEKRTKDYESEIRLAKVRRKELFGI